MKKSELLDHLARHVLDDRADMLNGVADELWSDEYLVRLLNEGARILCREAWVLEDVGHAQAGTIQLLLNTKDYALHKTVVRVLSGRLSDSDLDLGRVPYDLSRPQANTVAPTDFFYPDFPYSENPGRPRMISSDVTNTTLRVRPAPDADNAPLTVVLRVSRMPYSELAVTGADAEPEIPYEFHLDLVDYAAGEALSIPAADASMRAIGRDYRAKFQGRVKAARKDRQRKEMSPVSWIFGGWANDGVTGQQR